MCHGRLRRSEERAEDTRREGLWELFHRETEHPAPSVPIAERDEGPEPEREEVLSGAARRTND
jgi:hypothetical protein